MNHNNRSNLLQLIIVAVLSSLLGSLFSGGVSSVWASIQSGNVAAAIPYQGRLSSGGHPVTAELRMNFTIHDNNSGQSWTSPSPVSVDVNEGYFSHTISGFPADFLDSSDVGISLQVEDVSNPGSFVALSGQQKLLPSLYAFNAAPGVTFDVKELAGDVIQTTSGGVRIENDRIGATAVNTRDINLTGFPAPYNAKISAMSDGAGYGRIFYGLEREDGQPTTGNFRHSFSVGQKNWYTDNIRMEVNYAGASVHGDLHVANHAPVSGNPVTRGSGSLKVDGGAEFGGDITLTKSRAVQEVFVGDLGSSYGATYTQYCPAQQYVCGLKVQDEGNQGGGDDTGVNNIWMQCCTLGR